ncbi:MAG: inositol monophosphatase [Alphaproteobacteria bacterium]|nr:inositol monophosphatase [Alphaproteobacteria bacterium]
MTGFDERTGLAAKIARQAGEKILEIQKGDMGTVSKGLNDVLTIADTAAEEIITSAISKMFPDDAIIAEESGSKAGHTGYTWVIDPLDGTVNYSRRLPIYAVSVGCLKDGVPHGGAIFLPVTSELFVCQRGQGSWLNNERISVSANGLDKSIAAIGISNRPKSKPLLQWHCDMHKSLMENTMTVHKLFCAAAGLCYVAGGRMELLCELDCFLWDIAAGALLVEEAGGKITQTNGSPMDYTHVENQRFLCTNGKVHEKALELVRPKQ